MDDLVQGTDEWKQMRLGKVTASRIADATARTKTGYGASRANLMAKLIAERLTGAPGSDYVSPEMQWGTEHEPEARRAYEFWRDVEVKEVGFVPHPTIEMAGCSPDGLVAEDGLVEIKAPNTSTHIDTLTGQAVPGRYIGQMQFQMACTGRAWCDFVSFDPRLPPNMQLFVTRVHRDDAAIQALEKEVLAFLAELEEKVAALTRIYGPQQNPLAA